MKNNRHPPHFINNKIFNQTPFDLTIVYILYFQVEKKYTDEKKPFFVVLAKPKMIGVLKICLKIHRLTSR